MFLAGPGPYLEVSGGILGLSRPVVAAAGVLFSARKQDFGKSKFFSTCRSCRRRFVSPRKHAPGFVVSKTLKRAKKLAASGQVDLGFGHQMGPRQ